MKVGRPKNAVPFARKRLAMKLWYGGCGIPEICGRTGLWPADVYRFIKEQNAAINEVIA